MTKKIQILGSFSDNISVDDTLSQSGKAADAKATGDAIRQAQVTIDEVSAIVENLDDKYYTESEVDAKLSAMQSNIDSKSDSDHNHDDLYYTESEVDSMISELNSAIDAKANADHNHDDVYYTETEIDTKLGEMQSRIDSKVDAVAGKDLSTNDYTNAEKNKLANIEAEANKYEHPVHTSHSSGLYKVTVDESGHVSGATLAEKEDIVALGIPAQDTTYDTEISDLSDRIDDIENEIQTANNTLSSVSEELERYKVDNNEAVSTNASAIESNKTAIETIQGDYLTSANQTQLQDSIDQVSSKADENAAAIEILNGEGDGSVKQSIDNAFNEFAANISDDGVVNTYKELIDYAAQHGPEFTELVGTVDTINTHLGEVEADLAYYKTTVSGQFDAVNTVIGDHVDNIQESLDGKAASVHEHGDLYYGKSEIDELLAEVDTTINNYVNDTQEALEGKADLEHEHEALYYSRDEIDELLAQKSQVQIITWEDDD